MRRAVLTLLACFLCRAECRLPELVPQTGPVTPEALLEAGHFQRAKQLASQGPQNAHSYWLLSRAELGMGHPEAAVKLAEQSVALEGTRAEYHVQLAAANGRMAERASLFKQLGYAKRAKKELDTALEFDPNSTGALYGLILYYYAAPSFIGGDKQKALDAAERLTRINPAGGYLAQARLAKDRKDPVAEEAFYRKAIEAEPTLAEARTSLAQFELNREKPDLAAAEQQACQAVTLAPDRADGWSALAEAEARNQCWDELFAVLQHARVAVPDDAVYDYTAGDTLTRMNRHFAWAERFLRAYIAGPVENGEFLAMAHRDLAEALQRQNRGEEAKAELARATELDPSLAR